MKSFNKSRSSILLMEIIITIGLFMVCGAICTKFFVNAYLTNKKSSEISDAIVLASSSMEVMIGDGDEMSNLLNCYRFGEAQANCFNIYFDENAQECNKESAYYKVVDTIVIDDSVKRLKSVVSTSDDERVIYELESAKVNR